LVNFLFAFSDGSVFFGELVLEFCQFGFLSFCDFLLLLHLLLFVLLQTLKIVVVLLDVFELVVGQLVLGCRLQLHVIDLCLVVLILLNDVVDFILGVFLNRREGVLVALLGSFDVLEQFGDLGVAELHLLAMLFFLDAHLVLVVDSALG
jgi:hypothetical protein